MVLIGAAGLLGTWLIAAAPAERERVDVETVLMLGDEQFVVLLRTRGEPVRHLPIWVGSHEALAIRMRLAREKPPRPLTLDLLEAVLESGRIELVEISIDAVRRGVFLGTIRLKQRSRGWSVDARPSDAIGLAMGRSVPIWVAREVLQEASIDLDELGEKKSPEAPAVGPAPYEETL